MGDRLGVWKGVFCVFFCKRCSWGIVMEFSGAGNGCELGSGHGGFLGKFGMDPIWVIRKDVWLEFIDATRLGDLEG